MGTCLSKLERAATDPGLEIIAKLATVLVVEPGWAAEGASAEGRPRAG